MKIEFIASYNKILKYKIYDINGEKRKLVCKGKFLQNEEKVISVKGKELIVRIKRHNFFIAFLAGVYVGLANFFNFLIYRPRLIGAGMAKYLSLYPYEEIRIKDTTKSNDMEICYNPSPIFHRVDHRDKTVVYEYLTCKTHPYSEEFSARKITNRILYAFVWVFWLAVIESICQLIAFCAANR